MKVELTGLFLIISFLVQNVSFAQSEIGESEIQRSAPVASPKPKKRPYRPPTTSPIPITRPKEYRGELSASEIKELQSRPCPESEYCPGLPIGGDGFSPKCKEFISDQGYYPDPQKNPGADETGGYGITILEAMDAVEKAHATKDSNGNLVKPCSFDNNIDFNPPCSGGSNTKDGKCLKDNVCPNFKYLSPLQKQHVWVWVWASIAQAESSCDPKKPTTGLYDEALGRNKLATGLFGLEYTAEAREAAGRDERFCPHTAVPNSTTDKKFQSECAASIMYDRFCGKSLINEKSYWEEARYNYGKVWNLIKKHPLCK